MSTEAPKEVVATISSGGRVVIPAQVRRRLGLVQGSIVRFVVGANGVRLLPAAKGAQRLAGRLAAPAVPVAIEDMNQAIAEERMRIGGRSVQGKRLHR